MNIYELRSGMLSYHVAAENEDDAREQGQDPQRFPDLHFLPFTTTEIKVEGYTISATPNDLLSGVETVTGRGRRKAAG